MPFPLALSRTPAGTFETKDGRKLAGHPNNFDINTEYNQDKLRNRSETNASNTKPEKLKASVESVFTALLLKDVKMAQELVTLLQERVNDKIADQVMDEVEEVEAEQAA